jgi:hypothetical protein
MSGVTTTSIVETLQTEIMAVQQDKKLDIQNRVRLITMLTGQQLRAGGLQVAYLKAVSKLPEESSKTVLQLAQKEAA